MKLNKPMSFVKYIMELYALKYHQKISTIKRLGSISVQYNFLHKSIRKLDISKFPKVRKTLIFKEL